MSLISKCEYPQFFYFKMINIHILGMFKGKILELLQNIVVIFVPSPHNDKLETLLTIKSSPK